MRNGVPVGPVQGYSAPFKIAPIILPPEVTKGTGLFNPSVLIDDGKILVNLRHCQYTIYHSEKSGAIGRRGSLKRSVFPVRVGGGVPMLL